MRPNFDSLRDFHPEKLANLWKGKEYIGDRDMALICILKNQEKCVIFFNKYIGTLIEVELVELLI